MNILNAKSLFILMLCFIVTTATSADPVISVNINAIEAELNSDDVEERSITITNDGDELLEFSIDHEILNEPEEAGNGNPGGPLRDDLGDEIAEYEFDGEFDWTGLAWDGELMWGMDIGRQRMVAFDPVAEEVVESVFFNSQFFGFAYDGEAFWSCRFGDPNQGRQSELVRINRDGEIIATIEIQGGIWPLGVAFDGENLWYYSIDFEVEGVFIRQIALNGEEIRAVDCREIIQDIGLSIAWVNEHDDGQLWVKVWEGGTLYQINIDGEDPEVVQQADLEFGEVSGLEHDGENMWYTSAETDLWYVVDDGIMEDHWLTYEPREGEIEEDSDTDIIVTLDAADLIEGMYEADMIIRSNDPENEEIIVSIILEIIGFPELVVDWPEEIGWPGLIDWNEAFRDVFVGEPYRIPVIIRNVGTSELVVDEIVSENEAFRTEQEEFTLDPREEQEVMFIFESDETGDYEADMVIFWNDPDEENFVIPLHARSFNPPRINIEPQGIETDLDIELQIEEHALTVSNNGEANLRFIIEHVVISEPERDAEQRSIRSTGNTGVRFPQRDDLGDIIAEYDLGQAPWIGLAWDEESMWGLDLERERLVGFDPSNEEIVGEINLVGQYIGLTFDGEAFWTTAFRVEDEDPENMISRIDMGGNVIASFGAPGIMVLSLTFDGENLWYCGFDLERGVSILRQVTLEGEQIQEVDCRNIFNGFADFSITWVEEHDDGHLWAAGWEMGNLFQLNIEDEVAEVVQETQINQAEMYHLEHDGENLWYNTPNRGPWVVIDDGISETRWLSYEPTEGEIEAESSMDIFVTLDATGLITGTYEADLHFLSNDPDDDDVVVSIVAEVTGFPEVEVSWEEEFGWPDEINWNRAYRDIFTGSSYEISISVENAGTDLAMIEEISFDNELFTANMNEFELPPFERTEVILTLNAEEDGEHAAQMTISWNGIEEVIPLQGTSSGPPVIELIGNSIEEELEIGESAENVIGVTNSGASTLRFYIEHELIGEPDGHNGSLPSGPQRDDLGDEIAEFQMGVASWSGLAWDGELMWGMDIDRWQMISLNPETNQVENRNNMNSNYIGMAYDGESFWMGEFDFQGEQRIIRLTSVDREGNVMDNINVDGMEILGVAFNGENLLYYCFSGNIRDLIIREVTLNGEHINEIHLTNIIDEFQLSIAWVENHSGGQLWIIGWETGTLYQVNVEGEEPEIVQQTQLNQSEIYGLEHDGDNMWYTTDAMNNGNWYVIDDGIQEATWLTYEPESGEVDPERDIDVIVTIDATEMIEGTYEAELHFYSNDPENDDMIAGLLVEVGPTRVIEDIAIPGEFKLSKAFPNPFNNATTLKYEVPARANVSIRIYDIAGHLISTLVDAEQTVGYHVAVWDGQNNASGIYLVRMESQDFSAIQRIALVK